MPWSIPAPLLPDESISSWLARAALTQGCDPLALTGAVWPGWRVWTVDVDRGLPQNRLVGISKASGIPTEPFKQAATRWVAEQIVGHALPDSMTWPWILALGSRNRKRHGGQQYCPNCLVEPVRPYFRRHWRFAWHTCCELHGTLLLDRCHECGAPIEPHRLMAEDKHLARCARCKADLREARRTPVSCGAMGFQHMADEALTDGGGAFDGRRIQTSDWFAVAVFFVGLVRQAARREKSKLALAVHSLGLNVTAKMMPATGLPLELLSTRERKVLFEAAFSLLLIKPDEMVEAFNKAGVTATALQSKRSQFPVAVKGMLADLSGGKRRPRESSQKASMRPRSKRAVMMAWARLQRKMQVEALW